MTRDRIDRSLRPVAALDVDGVFALTDPTVPVWVETVSAYGKWRREILVPSYAQAIVRVLDELFDCVWVSAWSHTAHSAMRAALDLPAVAWPFLPVQFHKLDAIRDYAAGRSWVWIDDSIDDLGEVAPQPDGLLIRTDPGRGIHDVDPHQIYALLAAGGSQSSERSHTETRI